MMETLPPAQGTVTLGRDVAAEIRAWMGRRQVRQSQLARRLDESDQWLSMRLLARRPIDLDELQRIAAALGVRVADLLPVWAYETKTYHPVVIRAHRTADRVADQILPPARSGRPRTARVH